MRHDRGGVAVNGVACPKCEKPLMRRTARRGAQAGSVFWGCSAFPKCRHTAPSCSNCDSPLMRREAKRGANTGKAFWGCSAFPKCRHTAPIEDETAKPTELESEGVCRFSSPPPERPSGFMRRVFGTADDMRRMRLESDEPDATDRWEREHRLRVLKYLHERDSGRCGLCTGEIREQDLKRAHIEHIIPKDFVRFELSPKGKAIHGGHYESKLHAMDNLQIAHPRCNKKKGDTADVYRWRHPEMPQRAAGEAIDGWVLLLPPQVSKV